MPKFIHKVVKLDKGITKTKNKLFKEFLQSDSNYLFLSEDNCEILDDKVFQVFIDASKATGVEIMMWGNGGPNKRHDFNEDKCIDYYSDFTTAFVMYTRNLLEKVGLLDEKMPVNTWQELEHSKRSGDAGFSAPFGMFVSPKGIEKMLKLTKPKDEFRNLKKMDEALTYWEDKEQEDFPAQLVKKPVIEARPIQMI